MVQSYTYYLLLITKDDLVEQLKYPEKVLQKLSEALLKVKTENSFFEQTKT